MKSFSSAYENSREEVKSQREAIINQEHADIVNAMKKTFGVNNFATLNESERESYRQMLHKMWNKDDGLTSAGVKFIKESEIPLCESSTPDQIKRVFRSKIKANIDTIFTQAAAKGSNSALTGIYEEVKKDAGAAATKALMKEVLAEIIVAECKKRFNF